MKKYFIYYIIVFLLPFFSQAQVFETLHSDNYLKVKQDTTKGSIILPFAFSDIGDSIYHVIYKDNQSDSVFVLLIKDDLDNIEKKKVNNYFTTPIYYFNNNIYYFKSNQLGSFPIAYIETLILRTCDSIGNVLREDTVMRGNDDTIKWDYNNYRIELLEDKTIILIFQEIPPFEINDSDTIYDYNRINSLKIVKLDTMGNVLKSKIIYYTLYEYDICEMPNHLMFFIGEGFSVFQLEDKTKIYYLNKETLEPEDSIMGYYPSYMTKINDSLFAFYNDFARFMEGSPQDTVSNICLMNINNKRHINTSLRYYLNYVFMSFDSNPMSKVIDCKTTDSIYVCYLVRDSYYNYTAIEICNFNISGDTNFVYRINLHTGGFKELWGIKATQDGGLLLVAYSLENGFWGEHSVWLIKYHPNGLIGLANIETGEKESIKVYPNPAKDFINVDIQATNFEKGEIELFDMQGKLVKKAKLNAKLGNRVDVSNLNARAYTYNVSLNGKTISGKVIVGK